MEKYVKLSEIMNMINDKEKNAENLKNSPAAYVYRAEANTLRTLTKKAMSLEEISQE